jgi:hypothetical protein
VNGSTYGGWIDDRWNDDGWNDCCHEKDDDPPSHDGRGPKGAEIEFSR